MFCHSCSWPRLLLSPTQDSFLQVTDKVQPLFQAAPSSISLQTLTDSHQPGVHGILHEESRERDFPAAAPCPVSPSSITPSTALSFLYFCIFGCVCVCKWTQGRVQATAAFDQHNMWEMEHSRNADS